MICTGRHPERERGTWRGVWRASRATLAPSFLATLGMTFGMACASARDPGTSSAPAAPWTAPASAVPPALPKDEVPAAAGPLTLMHAIDIALANNPATRTTWLQARAAQGAAVILTTHILDVAERLATRIGILSGGVLLAKKWG